MAKTIGRKVVLSLGVPASAPNADNLAMGTYTVIGGGTSVSVDDAVSEVDTSTPNTATPANIVKKEHFAGMRTVSVNGEFTLVDDNSDEKIDTILKSETRSALVRVQVADYKTYYGNLFFTSVSFSGGLETATTMSLSGTFTGAITEA